jgi:S1-C subfamily serine protease
MSTDPSEQTTPFLNKAESPRPASVEPLMFTVVRVQTFVGQQVLTGATGFFFARDDRLYLVTSRHVLIDEPTQHFPDRLEIGLHLDAQDLTQATGFSMPLYDDGVGLWRQGIDSGGETDMAVLEIDRSALPDSTVLRAFDASHLPTADRPIALGTPLLVLGFPLGFHDTLHHMPVARHAVVASPFGLRFQGEGYFLTDARTHRGSSGAPVVMRCAPQPEQDDDTVLPWLLLGVHSGRLDMRTRDLQQDDALGLNCVWYADMLLTLTEASDPRASFDAESNTQSNAESDAVSDAEPNPD